MNESRARGLLSVPRKGYNRLVQSCPIVQMITITQVAYVMQWHAPTGSAF